MADATAIFTAAEARVFDKKYLADAQVFTDAVITAAEATIRAKFERIIGVALVPVTSTVYIDGSGSRVLELPNHMPYAEKTPQPVSLTSVTYLDSDDAPDGGTAFTAAELADLVIYPDKLVRRTGYFYVGYRNYKVVFKHGYGISGNNTCPADIKEAALRALVGPPGRGGIVPGPTPSTVIEGSDGTINWNATVDANRGRWFGNESIDSVLREHAAIESPVYFA